MPRFDQKTFVTSDGLKLVGDVGGPAGASTVILLHGGGQTRHSWSKTMDRLVTRGYHVINYDARGHGDSEWSADGAYGIDALSSDLRAVADTAQAPIAYVGASMGGITAFYTVGSGAPPKAQALVMVDIVLKAASAGVEKIRGFMSANRDGFASLEEAAAAVEAYNPARPRPSAATGLRKNLRLRGDGRLYWHWDPHMLDVQPSTEPPGSRLEKIMAISKGVTIPTLVVRGQHSDIVDDEGIEEMRRLVPQTEVHNVPGAGHMVAGDQNDMFAAGVMDFLERHFPAG